MRLSAFQGMDSLRQKQKQNLCGIFIASPLDGGGKSNVLFPWADERLNLWTPEPLNP